MLSNKKNNLTTWHPEQLALLPCALMLTWLAAIAMVVNQLFLHYPGCQYLPSESIYLGLILILMYAGCVLHGGKIGRLATRMQTLLCFFLILNLIALATTAVQWTPFSPIDHQLASIDRFFHIDTPALLAWTHRHPEFKKILIQSYQSLPYQMAYLPVLILFTRQYTRLHEHCFLLVVSTLIGFGIYYFFPTLAPASVLHSPYFQPEQQATSLKFMAIHHHTLPTTLDGGLIAMPSFHVIWAWLCVYLIRGIPWLFIPLLLQNSLLVASCVLLGWHYGVDVLASLLVILLSHRLYRYQALKLKFEQTSTSESKLNQSNHHLR